MNRYLSLLNELSPIPVSKEGPEHGFGIVHHTIFRKRCWLFPPTISMNTSSINSDKINKYEQRRNYSTHHGWIDAAVPSGQFAKIQTGRHISIKWVPRAYITVKNVNTGCVNWWHARVACSVHEFNVSFFQQYFHLYARENALCLLPASSPI